jgi:hypothetical protein
MRVAVGSVFAVMVAGFAFLVMKWAALWTRRGGGFSLLRLVSVGGSVFNDASLID